MARYNLTPTKWKTVVGTILFFALGFIVLMLMYGATALPWGDWLGIVNLALLFGVIGAYYGTIVALDRESGMSYADRPLLRFALCGVLASTAVLLVQSWPPQTFNLIGPSTGFLIGAMFGWLGWTWAKYVNF